MSKKGKQQPDEPRQVSQFDKIIKENIEAVIPSLMQNVLEITAVESEELPDDVQHTKERKPDVLKKVIDEKGDIFILQIEFQVADEPEMVYRMAEYHVMLQRKYQLPVRQYVIYLGAVAPKMPTQLQGTFLQFQYRLIAFTDLPYEVFLHSSRPEEVVLGVLANFKGQPQESVLEQILTRIDETTTTEFTLKRYIKQLRVLAQLRNLENKLKKVMDSIAPYISEERDALYLRGFDKAKEKVVAKLLTKSSQPFTLGEIAEMADVSTSFVKKIQQKIASGQ